MTKKQLSDTAAGKRYRARAAAQNLARIRLREAHLDEYRRYYYEAVEAIFKERGLGEP